ncbi:BofC C-terminal domain-containing protein [Alkaliphilus hydrothermalis]|uniref:Bypass of forespore C C-terminal domain-containing protein n=1 Tax=Alkaliphilus hydrothermalis TaxID=1482730 RepID=A0ABS2NLQ8_9FIRM|nr:BofC C-terminal domain-containing protein [Alkaliphilus hydrothermalis]MBM7613874.1 hypothetical protein [Alkaliphilus hydrothermalis]
MRRRRKAPFVIFALWLCIGMVGFLLGYYFAPEKGEKQPLHIGEGQNSVGDKAEKDNPPTANTVEEGEEEEEPENRPVSSYEVVVGEDTKVVFRTMYDRCKTINDDVMVPLENMVGLKEGEFKDYAADQFKEWQVVRFSGEEVVLYQMKDQYCPNHFLVMEDNGYIAIYQYNENGDKILVEKTQIPTSSLPKMDQDKLKYGIPLPTREKVDQLLEDYVG